MASTTTSWNDSDDPARGRSCLTRGALPDPVRPADPGRTTRGRPPPGRVAPVAWLSLPETPSPRANGSGRIPLPEGTLPVGAGLLVAGVASYLFFKVGVWALGEHDFAPISKLWFATFALAPGFFLPLEQEAGRALAHRRALGIGGRPVMRKVALLGALLALALGLILLALSPLIARHYFSGDWVMVVALVVAFVAYAPAHLTRGLCSGTGRFNAYAIVMGSDGAVRILLCAALALVGVKAIGPYGLVVAVTPLLGVAYVASRGALHTVDGPDASWSEVTPNLGWLLLGSVFAAGLVNAGPIATGILATPADEALVTQFSYGVLMTRVPLFLFQAVQAALLPRLARLAAQGDMDEFRRGFRQLMVVVGGVGVIGVIGSAVLGPPIIDVIYDARLTRATMAALAIGSACYMVALATAQAVIALHGHALVAVGWTVGMATFVVVTAVSGNQLFRRVEYGLMAGSAAAMVAFALAFRHRMKAGSPADQGSLLEAISDRPLEA